MLTTKPTKAMIDQWKACWAQYRDRLTPERKTGAEVVAYLKAHYPVRKRADAALKDMVVQNVMLNEPLKQKLPPGTSPDPVVYELLHTGCGAARYAEQAGVFREIPILVGVDLASGVYMVEGSEYLWDELCAFQGLDASDIRNYFSVAMYIGCLERFGRLEAVIGKQ